MLEQSHSMIHSALQRVLQSIKIEPSLQKKLILTAWPLARLRLPIVEELEIGIFGWRPVSKSYSTRFAVRIDGLGVVPTHTVVSFIFSPPFWGGVCVISGNVIINRIEMVQVPRHIIEFYTLVQKVIDSRTETVPLSRHARHTKKNELVYTFMRHPDSKKGPEAKTELILDTLHIKDYFKSIQQQLYDCRIDDVGTKPKRKKESAIVQECFPPPTRLVGITTINEDKIPIATVEEYYMSMVSKWREFDYQSIDGNAFTNLPIIPKIVPVSKLNPLQEEFVSAIKTSNTFNVFALTGPAGSGKTKCLDAVSDQPVLYVTIKGQLVQEVNHQCIVGVGITWAKLWMILLKLNFHQWLTLSNVLSQIAPNEVDVITSSLEFDILELPGGEQIREFKIIYIDEFTMITYGEAAIMINLLRKLDVPLSVVFVGDPAQIPPIQASIENNSRQILNLCTREFKLVQSMRFVDPQYGDIMSKMRQMILENGQFSILIDLIRSVYGKKIALCPQLKIEIYYPQEPFPTVKLTNRPGNIAPLKKGGCTGGSKCGRKRKLLELIVPKNLESPQFANNSIANARECLEWIEKYGPRINSFMCFHMTNLNVHINSLEYSRALEQLCGANVYYVKFFTLLIVNGTPTPFFGNIQSDRIQVLPLVVGLEYRFRATNTIIKNGSKLTLVHVEIEKDICKYLIMVDEYKVFFKVVPCSFPLPLMCSSRANYTANYTPEVLGLTAAALTYKIFGFPLTLASVGNIYQSQGSTLANRKLFINLTGCSAEEIYVALSRCTEVGQIEVIIL